MIYGLKIEKLEVDDNKRVYRILCKGAGSGSNSFECRLEGLGNHSNSNRGVSEDWVVYVEKCDVDVGIKPGQKYNYSNHTLPHFFKIVRTILKNTLTN